MKTSSSADVKPDEDDDLFLHLAADSQAPIGQQDFDLVEFGNFWLVYPKSRDKQATLTAWKAAVANGANPQKITAAAVAYAHDRKGQDSKYTKYSANWLRDARYEDVIDPDQAPAGGSDTWHPYRNPTDDSVYDEKW